MKRKFPSPCAEFNSGLLETSPILFPLKTIENFNCFQCAILAYKRYYQEFCSNQN